MLKPDNITLLICVDQQLSRKRMSKKDTVEQTVGLKSFFIEFQILFKWYSPSTKFFIVITRNKCLTTKYFILVSYRKINIHYFSSLKDITHESMFYMNLDIISLRLIIS